jgi:hypothetical protein
METVWYDKSNLKTFFLLVLRSVLKWEEEAISKYAHTIWVKGFRKKEGEGGRVKKGPL